MTFWVHSDPFFIDPYLTPLIPRFKSKSRILPWHIPTYQIVQQCPFPVHPRSVKWVGRIPDWIKAFVRLRGFQTPLSDYVRFCTSYNIRARIRSEVHSGILPRPKQPFQGTIDPHRRHDVIGGSILGPVKPVVAQTRRMTPLTDCVHFCTLWMYVFVHRICRTCYHDNPTNPQIARCGTLESLIRDYGIGRQSSISSYRVTPSRGVSEGCIYTQTTFLRMYPGIGCIQPFIYSVTMCYLIRISQFD